MKPNRRRSRRGQSPPPTLDVARRRVLWMLGAFAVAGLVLVGRALQLQWVDASRYVDAAERQSVSRAQVRAKRGAILDRTGAELAMTVDVDSVYAEPHRIENLDETAARLAPLLGRSAAQIRSRMKRGRRFVYLARRVDGVVGRAVRTAGIRGVGTHKEPRRYYSNLGLAAHVLGFTNIEGKGQAGLERSLDNLLRGRTYEIPSLRDALGNRVMSDGFVSAATLEGADIRLTIDRRIQHVAEQVLGETVEKRNARAGVAVVLEAGSSDILAMASYPTFNPNNLTGVSADAQLNRAISAVYEPGSTMKLVTVAAAIEEKVVRPNDKMDCEDGAFSVGGRTIGDASHRFGLLSISEVVSRSSNICAAKIGLALGRDRMHRWLRRFGFGERVGVRLPGELGGLIRPADSWREIALANIAFGQGLAVTPLQVVQAASVWANGGRLVRPRLVAEVIHKNGRIERPVAAPAHRVLSKATVQSMQQMMIDVTLPGGTATAAQVPGFLVAGKTGTAQKVDPSTGAYSHAKHVASFVGYVPARKPEVVILVLIDEPKGAYYGGSVAGPAFRSIAYAALAARGVFPRTAAARQDFESGMGKTASKMAEVRELAHAPSAHLDAAPAPVVDAGPDMWASLSPDAQALLGVHPAKEAPATEGVMPDLRGLSGAEALKRALVAGCRPSLSGRGWVRRQRPAAGAKLASSTSCEIELSIRVSPRRAVASR